MLYHIYQLEAEQSDLVSRTKHTFIDKLITYQIDDIKKYNTVNFRN